jgi:hypothetical protein
MSDTGRYIVFTKLFGGDIYRFDRETGAVALVVSAATNNNCGRMDVSDDGNTVAFNTVAALDLDDINGDCDAYVWRQGGGVNWLRSGSATPDSAASKFAALTPNGRFALFTSTDRTLVPGDTTESFSALFLRDLTTGATTLESRDNSGAPLVQGGLADADLSDDASQIAFHSFGDPTGVLANWSAVYLRDRTTGQSRRVVSSINGGPVFTYAPTIDATGRFVALRVDWGQVQARQQSQYPQVGIVNLTDNSIQLASHRHGDPLADGNHQSDLPQISADGTTAAFTGFATDLIDPPPSGGFLSRVYSYGITGRANPDRDADGILDVVDADGGAGTSPGAFADSYVSGRITSVASGMTVTVTDAPDPLDGVRIQVTGAAGTVARISACGFTTSFRAGTDAVLTCGSVIARVERGTVDVVLGDGQAFVTVPAGVDARVGTAAGGGYFVDVLADDTGSGATITNGGATSKVGLEGGPTPVQAWKFDGYAQPVDNGGVVNVVKGGQVVPLRWRLTESGKAVTILSSAKPTFATKPCSATSPTDQIEQTAASASGLRNLGNGNYEYNWKTPASKGVCGELRLDVGDGVLHTAQFRLT